MGGNAPSKKKKSGGEAEDLTQGLKMRAIVLRKPNELECMEVPIPLPKKGEVLIKVFAAPINPSDIVYTQGKYALKPTFPTPVGFEGSGLVIASGGGFMAWNLVNRRVGFIS
jgi:NADPH:quinone reductase-like Zn-dependent oxidoreductase